MQETIHVHAGDCTVRYEGDESREERGTVVVLTKPDNTILVHDRDGYRPIAWLTRADTLNYTQSNGRFDIEATRDDQQLHVTCHDEFGHGEYMASPTGPPVGTCPDCAGALVYSHGTVTCLGCYEFYGVPRDALILDETCRDCELPLMRVTRGAPFDVCIDRSCDPLDAQVRDRYDREWQCPACGNDLRVLRRGGLLAGCDNYPECETGFSIPSGTIAGTCAECHLPLFQTASGQRCLDSTCSPTET